jgi:hypothetical protein
MSQIESGQRDPSPALTKTIRMMMRDVAEQKGDRWAVGYPRLGKDSRLSSVAEERPIAGVISSRLPPTQTDDHEIRRQLEEEIALYLDAAASVEGGMQIAKFHVRQFLRREQFEVMKDQP